MTENTSNADGETCTETSSLDTAASAGRNSDSDLSHSATGPSSESTDTTEPADQRTPEEQSPTTGGAESRSGSEPPASEQATALTLQTPPTQSLDDVAGLPDVKNRIQQTVFQTAETEAGPAATPSLLVHGQRGSGYRAIAQSVAGSLGDRGYAYAYVDAVGHHTGEFENFTNLFEQARAAAPVVLFLECFDDIYDQTAINELHTQMEHLRATDADVFVIGTVMTEYVQDEVLAQYARAFDVRVGIEIPDRDRRAKLLTSELAAIADRDAIAVEVPVHVHDQLAVELDGYSPREISGVVRRAAARATATADDDETPTITTPVLRETIETCRTERVANIQARTAVADLDIASVSFDDIGGLRDAKAHLQELLTQPLERRATYEACGLTTGGGILLHGPPGNGKTMLAKAVATETDRTFISVTGPKLTGVMSSAEERIHALFEKARRNAPSVIFFDEFDSIGVQRGHYDGARDDVTNTLLTELDGVHDNEDVIVMAATNRLDALDPAVLRPGRFEHLVEVTTPTDTARAEIFQVHTSEVPLAGDVTPEWFSRTAPAELSGAEIAALAEQAVRVAIRRQPHAAEEPPVVHRCDVTTAISERAEWSGQSSDEMDRMFC
ncbi:AAA family ATPase [Halobaculum sp. MBLA0147]|uniref:AAA family ATPase n=1 Tax=Halobaculum sp. MBLA0147 TaxID=3079934 RepID=UPI003525FB50